MFCSKHALLLAACAAWVAPAWAAEWMGDYEAACRRATAEGRPVLMHFTGTDWCLWCRRLRENVLDTPEFTAYAQGKFVLLEIDVPLDELTDESSASPRRQLCARYMVDAFPSVFVITPEGVLVGGFEGGLLSSSEARAQLDAAYENARALTEACRQTGEARARALHAIYDRMPEDLQYKSSILQLALPSKGNTPAQP